MDINSFQTLDREAQLAEAGKIAGVEPSVFDGMWRTESGRGAAMLSPAGAEGHFGLMPKTRKAMEQRFGAPIDPYNFGQALFTSAHLMKENLGRFGNLPDALRAYNGGWDPKSWGNPETTSYPAKVLGTDEEEGDAQLYASTAEAVANGAATRHVEPLAMSLWERRAAGPSARANPPADLSPVMAAVKAATFTKAQPPEPDFGPYNAMVARASDKGVAEHKLAEDTTLLDTMRAAAHSTLLQQTLIATFKDQYPADPNFTFKEEELKGKTVDEQRDLRAARSRREFDRILFDQDYDKEQSDITNRNGALYGFGASLLADLPGAAITGGLSSLGFKAAGVGAMELAAEGRRAAALGSLAVEGIAGNVAYTAGLDALGKHQGTEGYAMAVAGGLLNPLLGGKAIGREVDRAQAAEQALRIAANAKKQQELLLVQAKKNLGESANGDELAAEMTRLEAEGLRADIASHTATVPESRKFNVGSDLSEETAAPAEAAPADKPFEAVHSRVVADSLADTPTEYTRLLPTELQGSKPRYAFGDKQFTLEFDSELDMAAYVVAGAKKSKNDAKFMDWLGEVGFTPEEARAHGQLVRERIKAMAAAEPEGKHMIVQADKAAGWDKVEGRTLTDDALMDRTQFWESPDYQAERQNYAKNDQGWRDSIFKRTEGEYTPEKLDSLPEGVSYTSGMMDAMERNPKFDKTATLVENIVAEYMPGAKVLLTTGAKVGENGSIVSLGDKHIISLNLSRAEKGQTLLDHTAIHELGHAIFHHHAPQASPRLIEGINKSWLEFADAARAGKPGAWDRRYGATSEMRYNKAAHDVTNEYHLDRDEYMAEQFVQHFHNRMMRGDFGNLDKSVVERVTGALAKVVEFLKGIAIRVTSGLDAGPDEFFTKVLKTMEWDKKQANEAAVRGGAPTLSQADSATPGGKAAEDVKAHITDPLARKYGLDMLPLSTPSERAEAKQILDVYRRADAWAAANPIDEKRLNRILSRFDSFDPISNQMLRSANPVVRMVASELLENGGGAAGRRSSAAISKYMNERAIIGNVINDLDGTFNLWLKGQGSDRMGEFFTGRKRVEFNKLVAEEIEQRRYPGAQSDFGDHVRAAADAVEQSFERARLMQVDAKTIGWGSLPETSKGYMPHRLSAEKVRSLSNAQKRALHGALTDQFIDVAGFDMSFADQLASKYLDRVEQRALGGFDAPAGLHQTGAHEVVKEALEAMGMNRAEVEATLGRYMKGGAGHTKKRLNLDLRQKFTNDDGTTFRLLDLFDTDMLNLVRGQSQRVSGEVALARHGIMGKPGLAILKRGMTYGEAGVTKAAANELEAFDAMAAEFLGSPFGTQNKWVDRAMQANSVASLGGMGFNQLGEIINVATTLGVGKAFSAIASIARMRAEIKLLAKGKPVENPWLQSIEKMGGAEFGTDAYKMVFPMDLPDAPINTMGVDTLSVTDRLLRGGGHLQSKLSAWRAIHSMQMRGVAEQIVRTFADALHTGKTDITLSDMGLTADVLERLRADKDNILIVRDGKFDGFDITQATDKDAAMQLVQAVHRGAGQMIQGTFIGEQGKYVHNSYLKMLAQFRGFSLTAIDKQWNRQKANKGAAAAFAMTVGAMGAATPIYMIRTYLASIGREDQDAYLEKQLSFGAIARATTNYIATSGLAGDFLDVLTAVSGHGEMTGGRSGTNTNLVGNLAAPALGKVDKLWGAVQNTKDGTDVHGFVQQMPFARLPVLIPAINALGH